VLFGWTPYVRSRSQPGMRPKDGGQRWWAGPGDGATLSRMVLSGSLGALAGMLLSRWFKRRRSRREVPPKDQG